MVNMSKEVNPEEYTTILKILPVCNCGYIFRKGITIHQEMLETNGWEYPKTICEPYNCPNCKKVIKGIEINKDKFLGVDYE